MNIRRQVSSKAVHLWACLAVCATVDAAAEVSHPLPCIPEQAASYQAASETVCAITTHQLDAPIYSFSDGTCNVGAAGTDPRGNARQFTPFSAPDLTQVANIAQGKPFEACLQYSTSYYPQYANDASESTSFISHGSVARPWWMVDLQDINLVDRVEVLPRSGVYAYRFHQVEVRVGSTPRVGEDFSEWPLLGFYEGPYAASEGRLTFANETKLCGRYVVVQRVAAQVNLLELADVKVFVHLP
ncbi:uncharacterized protein LOC125037310 [Penaeus chinensis]|uniref:uncharacterized protein LOC125037310 n=1 Tax=Penaeus chinensis TaxID=139456 RepID=UPI001FB76BC0|nr:uncharacterized protein LOC125037310 [Penaeus chinensis]